MALRREEDNRSGMRRSPFDLYDVVVDDGVHVNDINSLRDVNSLNRSEGKREREREREREKERE